MERNTEQKTKLRHNLEMTVLVMTLVTMTVGLVINFKILKYHQK